MTRSIQSYTNTQAALLARMAATRAALIAASSDLKSVHRALRATGGTHSGQHVVLAGVVLAAPIAIRLLRMVTSSLRSRSAAPAANPARARGRK